MTLDTTNALDIIDRLIEQHRSFAIYRIPGEITPRFIMQTSGAASLLSSIEELNEQQGFVIAPFRISTEQHPIVLIRCDRTTLPSEEELCDFREESEFLSKETPTPTAGRTKEQYIRSFERFIHPLQSGRLEKLVLSRNLVLDREAHFSPARAFSKACERYIRSYVYLCHTPQTGTWLGSTPEILLSGERGAWHTVALAGTQRMPNGNHPIRWDDKNRREQLLVVNYLNEQLRSLAITPTIEGPYTARAGALCHLKSDLRFRLEEQGQLGTLLKLLHPTPAVCGLPKEEAYHFIQAHEGYDRSYYTGFIGRLDPAGRTDLYVNLRCMRIGASQHTLYAGGGLLSSSRLADEWEETEDKLQTMRAIL